MVQSHVDTLHIPENLFALIFATSPVATAILSGADGRILHVNQRFLDLLGYQLAEVIGATIEELQIWQAPSLHLDYEQHVPVRTHGDELRTLRWSTVSIALDNQDYTIVTLQDIIECQIVRAVQQDRKELAQRVEECTADLRTANAQLAQAARLKTEFLASMSHELRTPLHAILGYAEALLEQVRGSDALNAAQIKALDRIAESGRHLLTVINDILDVAKIEAGALNLSIDDVSVTMLCNACIRLIAPSAQMKQINLTVSIDPYLTFVRCDGRRMKQILVNLLSNAVKFTPGGGSIGLEVTGNPDQARICFTVWDTGIGIAREHLAHLFKPFIQLDSSLSRQYSGSGLGLVLVARMIELHGGKVYVESTLGEGSRFTVTLPWNNMSDHVFYNDQNIDNDTKTEIPLAKKTHNQQNNPLIFLVENNETNIIMIQDYLSVYGYTIVVARNDEELVRCSAEQQPDIILVDIQVPFVDGVEAIRHIRRNQRLVTTPLIALSALATPGDRERCLEAGASEYVCKPVNLSHLLGIIKTYLLARNI